MVTNPNSSGIIAHALDSRRVPLRPQMVGNIEREIKRERKD